MFAAKIFNLFKVRNVIHIAVIFFHCVSKFAGRNTQRIFLPCSIDICYNDMVCMRKRLYKFREQCFCPGVSVRLENTPDLAVRIMSGSRQAGSDLCRMMCIVIDDSNTVKFPFVFKTTICSMKLF